uniref:YoaK family protein n=1 Tax=Bordetella sputigena TaxID=1416810 RepID=UPI0039EF1894
MPAAGTATAGDTPAWLLSFTAGYVDVVGFAALFGLFTAHVTGNFVMIGVQLIGASDGLLAKLLALPVFIVAVGGTRLLEAALRRRAMPVVPILFAVECVLLALFMAAGLAAEPVTDPGAPSIVICGMLGVAAMGIQNAMSRTVLSEAGPTTIMTGNTTQIVIDAVDLRSASPEARAAIRRRLGKMLPAVAGFAAGAIIGALAFKQFSFWCGLVPTAILLGLAIRRPRSAA